MDRISKSKSLASVAGLTRRSGHLRQCRSSQEVPSQPPMTTRPSSQKHRRSRDTEGSDGPEPKQQRPSSPTTDSPTADSPTADNPAADGNNPLVYWATHQRWPSNFFELQGSISDLPGNRGVASMVPKEPSPSSNNSATVISYQQPRGGKSALYRTVGIESILLAKNVFFWNIEPNVGAEMKKLFRDLLETEQSVPENSLFRDDLFEKTCKAVEKRKEYRIIRDITPLLVPSVEVLMMHGLLNHQILIESVNEGWNCSVPITLIRPQPDYSVGFRHTAFTKEQLKRLKPFVGATWEKSYFAATCYMYFPFLSCEVKCFDSFLCVADRQNMHSMTLAVRAVVELYQLVRREKEVDRKVLAFSISHNQRSVRIYGHYAVINGENTKYYRHMIHDFNFTAQNGKDKWTAYTFTKNVYDNWVPVHFKRICSAIADIPSGLNFDVSWESELNFSEQD